MLMHNAMGTWAAVRGCWRVSAQSRDVLLLLAGCFGSYCDLVELRLTVGWGKGWFGSLSWAASVGEQVLCLSEPGLASVSSTKAALERANTQQHTAKGHGGR